MKIHKNITKGWRTTTVGLSAIAGGIFYLTHSEELDKVILFGLFGLGIALLLFPDDFVKIFKDFLIKNKDKNIP